MPPSIALSVLRALGGFLASVLLVVVIVFGIKHYGHAQMQLGDAAGYARGHAEAQDIQTRWDADRMAWQASELGARRDYESRVKTLTDQNERITHEKAVAVAALRSDVAYLAAERDGLRDQVRAYIASLSAGSPGAGSTDHGAGLARIGEGAATLGELFSECTQRYSALAQEADDVRSSGVECGQRYGALKNALNQGARKDGE